MITDLGKAHIKRFFAGEVPTVAQTIVLGIGSTTAVAGDQKLAHETARVPITLKAYDKVADKVVYKGEIPDEYIGKITEIGILSIASDTLNDLSTLMISTFDQLTEEWTGASWASTNTRLGVDSLRLSPTLSTTLTASVPHSLDLSQFSPTDGINLAIFTGSNVANVKVKFLTDSSNYYLATITTPAAGYSIQTVLKSAFAATGTPAWSNITGVEVSVTATAGGTAAVDFDALSFVDLDFANPDLVLVAREVLGVVVTKVENTVNEVEFRLGVTVS